MIRVLVFYNLRRSALIHLLGAFGCLAPSFLFALLWNHSEFRDGVSLVWLGWIVSMYFLPVVASFLGAEIFGREVPDGPASMFSALPISRVTWITAKSICCLATLVSWIAMHLCCAGLLRAMHEFPRTWNGPDIAAATIAAYAGAVCAAAVAGFYGDYTGSISISVLGSWGTCLGVLLALWSADRTEPLMQATFLITLAAFAFSNIYLARPNKVP